MEILRVINEKNIIHARAQVNCIIDYIYLLLDICEYILNHRNEVECFYQYYPKESDLIILNNRVYIFYNESKYVSTYFPFNFSPTEGVFFMQGLRMDYAVISHVKSVIDNIQSERSIYRGIDTCNDGCVVGDPDYVTDTDIDIVEKLFNIEPCYVRYDYDTKNVKGDFHPMYHLDVNISYMGRMKIGIRDKVSPKRFFEIFQPNVECEHFEEGKLWKRDKGYMLSRVMQGLISQSGVS